MYFELSSILNSFKLNDKMDKEKYSFLKNYDANNNSIFDQEDIDKLQNDLKQYSNQDKDDKNLTNQDILAFYNNAMSKISSNFKKISLAEGADALKQMFDWLTSNNNSDKLSEIQSNDDYKSLTGFQQKIIDSIIKYSDMDYWFESQKEEYTEKLISIAKKCQNKQEADGVIDKIYEITSDDSYSSDFTLVLALCSLSEENYNKIKNSDVMENYEDYILADLLNQEEGDTSRIVNIILNNTLHKDTVIELAKLSPESEKEALNIINRQDMFMGVDVAKSIDFKGVLPDNFFDNIKQYDVKRVVGDCLSYTTQDGEGNPAETFFYDREFGLYEIRKFNAEENKETVINLRTNTIETIEYINAQKSDEDLDTEKIVKKDVSVQYDSLKYDKTTGTYSSGNIVSTKTISQSSVDNMYNITTLDAEGNQILPSQYCSKNENGGLVISRDLVSPSGVKTSYHYEDTVDNMQIIDYTITDKDGNILMDRHQTMQIIDKNKVLTSINDKLYEAEFSDGTLIITDKSNGNKKEIKLGFITEGKELMVELLKTIPANLLMAMDTIPLSEMSYDENGDDDHIHNNAMFNHAEHWIKIGHWDDLENKNLSVDKMVQFYVQTMIHEYGHYLDYEGNEEIGLISSNDVLCKVHDSELSNLIKNSTTQEQNYLTHMIDDQYKKSYGTKESDYIESLAEAIAVLSGKPGNADFASYLQCKLSLRQTFLMKDFPEYIAKINESIEQKYLNN